MKIFIISCTITNSLHSYSSVRLTIRTHWEGCCEICLIAFLPLSPQADQDHGWSLFVISTYLSNHTVDKRSICLVKRSKQSYLDESNMRLSILIPANRSFHSSKTQFLVPKDCWPSKKQTWHIYVINLMYISWVMIVRSTLISFWLCYTHVPWWM